MTLGKRLVLCVDKQQFHLMSLVNTPVSCEGLKRTTVVLHLQQQVATLEVSMFINSVLSNHTLYQWIVSRSDMLDCCALLL